MPSKYRVTIVGATGVVGREILKLLEKSKLLISTIRCIASSKSKGNFLTFKAKKIKIEILQDKILKDSDIIFFCAGSSISKQYLPLPYKGPLVIDLSSAFRQQAPLIIPEINGKELKNHKGLVASPNCTTTIMLMALHPLHKSYRIKRIIAASYQAASGGGYSLMQKLTTDTKNFLNNQKQDNPFAFNLYLHDSPLDRYGYSEEENKMTFETQKILNDHNILVSATCVRVPILRAHSLALNVEFEKSFSLSTVKEKIRKTEGLTLFENFQEKKFITPLEATEKEEIFCSRIRRDKTQANTLEMWVVGDQLLKGAALNAVQIAEAAVSKKS